MRGVARVLDVDVVLAQVVPESLALEGGNEGGRRIPHGAMGG